MNKIKRISLELASHPLRNRRLFFICLGVLVVFLVGLTAVSSNLYIKNGKKLGENRSKIEVLELKLRNIQREEVRLTNQLSEEASLNQPRIDLVNSIIRSKSFSWTSFLSDLEEALPGRCYIVSLAPAPRQDLGMEVRIRVASPNLDDLLLFYTRLGKLGFKNVLIRSEEQAANGLLFAEVSFSYERNI